MKRISKYLTLETLGALFIAVVLVLLTVSCGSKPVIRKEGPYLHDDDDKDIPEPSYRSPKLMWESIDRTVFVQGEQLLDIGRNARKLSGNPKQAININSHDEVPNSSWFTNRHAKKRMTPADITRGVSKTGGPDTSGIWTVFRPKIQGATPGFWIEDSRGNQFIIKFDPPGHPELATAAAAMGSRYFYACGYNVPEETIVYWKPDKLKVREGITYTDAYGNVRPFTPEALQEILSKVERNSDGYFRSLASSALKNVKGPFSYDGVRKDDPNDWCPHQHRRELRGLFVIASLINHYDTKDQNTLDAFEERDGRNFLRHYLIDFGSTFGSDGDGAKVPVQGYANIVDPRDIFVSLITLGLKTWPWEKGKKHEYPSIGYFESEIFEPDKFDPIMPNPAFDEMTDRDAFWGAKIVMSFRDDDLAALVDAGKYSDEEAAAYLLKTLIERRDKIGRHWFSKVNPLDNFDFTAGGDSLALRFEDLAVKYDLESANRSQYRFSVKYRGKTLISKQPLDGTRLVLSSDAIGKMISLFEPPSNNDDFENFVYEIRIETKRDNTGWSKPTRIWLWYDPVPGDFSLAGIEHSD